MHIGIFTDAYTPLINGLVISVSLLVQQQLSRGNRVTVIAPKHNGTPYENHVGNAETDIEENSKENIKENIIRLGGITPPFKSMQEQKFILFTSRSKYREIMACNFDVIHTHTEFNIGRLGRKVARKKSIPLVHTYHTMYEDYMHFISRYFQFGLKTIAKLYSCSFAGSVDELIFPTAKVKKAFAGYGFKKPSHVIPTGLDLEKFRKKDLKKINELKKKLNITPNCFLLVYVGRISLEKGIVELVKHFSVLARKQPQVKLLLVGDGPEKKNISKQVKKLGLNERVIFSGMVPPGEVPDYYHLGQGFVNASTTETQGLTYIEALACGLPNLVKYDKNLDGVVVPGENGFFWQDQAEFVENFTKLCDKKKHSQLQKNALKSVEKFGLANFVAAVSAVYEKALNKKALRH